MPNFTVSSPSIVIGLLMALTLLVGCGGPEVASTENDKSSSRVVADKGGDSELAKLDQAPPPAPSIDKPAPPPQDGPASQEESTPPDEQPSPVAPTPINEQAPPAEPAVPEEPALLNEPAPSVEPAPKEGETPPSEPESSEETQVTNDPSPSPEAPPPVEYTPVSDESLAPVVDEALKDDGTPRNSLTRLSKKDEIWIDSKQKKVVVNGRVCLRQGPLEMFACPQGSKEHESIVAVNSSAQLVHAGLLAVGAEPGHPVRFAEEYQPAEGPRVDVIVVWTDKDGKRYQTYAQQWVQSTKTKQAMDTYWVFGGSGFWRDEESGKDYYLGEQGDLICVSNFPTATMDLPVKSSDSADSLLFEAFTSRIPPRDTEVTLILIPRLNEQKPSSSPTKE